MKHTAPITLAVALLTIAAACHKDNKEARLKALDEAYKSGVFTKEEYDAKKQAIVGSPPAPAPSDASAPAAPAPAPAGAIEPAPPANPPAAAAPDTSVAPPVTPAPPPAVQTAPPPVPAQAVSPPVSSPRVRPSPQIPPRQVAPSTPSPQVAAPVPAPSAAPVEPAEAEPAPLAGCRDAESRAGGPNGVQERFFLASEDAVWQAANLALRNLDFTIHRSTAHEIEASKRRHLSVVIGAGGEKVILHFSSANRGGQAGTKVTGETKKSITGRLAQKSWTTAVLAQIACNLRGGR